MSLRPPNTPPATSSRALGKSDYERLSDFRHRLRQFLRASELACRAHGLTALQYQLLLHVAGFPGRACATIGELAERLQAQHHGVVALVDRCAALGLLARRPGREDGRVVEVHLLPKGERLPQIEGAAFEDGKGASVWDTIARQPGKVHNGDNLDVACDHYHRYADDLALMAALGAKHYRLSIAWPRIFPTGRGQPHAAGFAFYNRLIDKALELGLTPWVTMFHWDLPQTLEDEFGGWRGRATAEAFGDRVKHWITLNEIICFTANGYGDGSKAPGLQLPAQVVNQTYHHAVLAHGLAVRAVRQFGGAGAVVGLTDNSGAMIPLVESPADIAAACQAFVAKNTRVLEPIFKGRYHPDYLKQAGADAPVVEPGDLALISQPTDFLGLNIYRGSFVRAGANGQAEVLPFPPSYPRADAPWLTHTPQAIYWSTRMLTELYGVRSIYITENGAGYNDEPPVGGEVLDLHRRDYLRNYLRELQRAIDDGAPVHGYFLWSFMDNFEWAEGYQRRFGVVYTDYATQQRTPKASARWYSEVMRANAIV